MYKGLYIIAADDCQDIVWEKIIQTFSLHGSSWIVDCLDCLYDTKLVPGYHSTEKLISELKDNKYVFFARMIGVPEGENSDRKIVTADDYFNSNCHSIALCVDGNDFELFSKYEDQLYALREAIPSCCIDRIEWTDDSLGGRSIFRV